MKSSNLVSARTFQVALLSIVWLTSSALAQSPATMPGGAGDARMMNVQNKVESLYESGDYKRAFFIYQNELAPLGDKYAQYMVGYMYLSGQGTSADAIEASAWYRLAAERGNLNFVKTRDRLLAGLAETDRRRADQVYVNLRRQYGDLAVINRLARQDFEILQSRTGSRLGSGGNSLTIIDRHDNVARQGDDYFHTVEKRLAERVAYLAEKTNFKLQQGDIDKTYLDALDDAVQAKLGKTE